MTAVAILGRPPECPDCGAVMQELPSGDYSVWRCPWTSPGRYRAGIAEGLSLISCDWPLRDRKPYGIGPYGLEDKE